MFCMKLFNIIAKYCTNFQGEFRNRRKIIKKKKNKKIVSSLQAYDVQLTLQGATQNFKFKFEFLELQFERVKRYLYGSFNRKF